MGIFVGIAFNHHDSSVSFALENRVVLVLEAERVFREKKIVCTKEQIEYLIQFGLDHLGKKVTDIESVALATLNNPYLESKINYSDIEPYWIELKLFGRKIKSLVVNHHLAHASSTYLTNSKNISTIITCDGGGDNGQKHSVYIGKEHNLELQSFSFEGFTSAKPYFLLSTYLYRKVFTEGSMMALAAFGSPTEKYIDLFEKQIEFLSSTHSKANIDSLYEILPNFKGRANANDLEVCNVVASFQKVFVERKIRDIKNIISQTKISSLSLAGGCFLNLELNTEIYKNIDNSVFIPPCPDDTGQALGALCFMLSTIYKCKPKIKFPYLGLGVTETMLYHNSISQIADLLIDDYIVILHNGSSEIGPRALGNRSFIARPDSLSIKNILSEKIKCRESYRPVAPITIDTYFDSYFEGNSNSPFMLFQHKVKPSFENRLVGAVHNDKTARVQTVTSESNFWLFELIKNFGNKTGLYVLLNTSLNLKGEPLSNELENTINIATFAKTIYSKIAVVYNGELQKI